MRHPRSTGTGKAYPPCGRRGEKGFGVTDWSRPDKQGSGKAQRSGQAFEGAYTDGMGRDRIDRSAWHTGLSGNTDQEGE
jgi:hypothetical protein